MENVLTQLSGLTGVSEASVYSADHKLYSNMGEEQQLGMIDAGNLFEQVFLALRSSDKNHNEAYVEFDRGMMIAYEVKDTAIILLLTLKKVNLPMLGVSLKLASRKLHVILGPSDQAAPGNLTPGQNTDPAAAAASPKTAKQPRAPSAADNKLRALTSKLEEILVDFLGPAAKFVLADCIVGWKASYPPTPESYIYLIEMISDELDTSDEKADFRQQIRTLKI